MKDRSGKGDHFRLQDMKKICRLNAANGPWVGSGFLKEKKYKEYFEIIGMI